MTKKSLGSFLTGCAMGLALTASAADPLAAGFRHPPDSAKPRTWWHWMNGNITRPGIAADLTAMKQIGLGGATVVNVDCDIPPGPVAFMSPEWRQDFKFAVQEANRLGLELSVENCAGWSSSGGPWNTVTHAMQCLTASKSKVCGPTNFDARLPLPPVTLGFYRDIAVLAFKDPAAGFDSEAGSGPARLEIKHAFYEAESGDGSTEVTDKLIGLIKSGHKSVVVDNEAMGKDPAPFSIKQLRVELTLDGRPATVTVGQGDTLSFPTDTNQLAAMRAFDNTLPGRTFVRPPAATIPLAERAVPHAEVLNLSAKMGSDGLLRWKAPPGRWVILRVGSTPIGVDNHPAPEAGKGLECDKLSPAALDAHWDGFMGKVLADAGPLAGRTLKGSLIDSYEIGNQDWTADFRREFQRRRHYDPLPFLPAFSRCIMDNPAVTERFLRDMRRTVADLFAENYYGHFNELCRRHGLTSEIEPYTGPFESLQCGAPDGVVMGEFWAGSQGDPSVKLAASVAHIYGKSIVGAESFTGWPGNGCWQDDPYGLKPLGDAMFCEGVNRFVFHRYAMQPWTNRWPGMTMGAFGINFERTSTWWHQGRAWIQYLSRCQFLLQQGRAVADAAYFDGQSAPVVLRAGHPALPAGYDYDGVDEDVLLHGARVKHGRVTLASGANYALLVLPPDDRNLTPRLLARLRGLVRAGAVIVGPPPLHAPGLTDYPGCDRQVAELAAELWGPCDGRSVLEHACGRGRVIWGKPLADIFTSQGLPPDFAFQGECAGTELRYAHRTDGPADIYFVSNQRRQFDAAECTFRVHGRLPELWHPDTGAMERAPVWSVHDGRTTVRLAFDPAGSVFVIFRQPVDGADHIVSATNTVSALTQPKLEIQHAAYQAAGGAGKVDVTAKLSGLIRDGTLTAKVGNETFGGDPAVMQAKELQVDYTLAGRPGRVTVKENEWLTLPLTAAAGQALPGDIQLAADGSVVVRAWADGRATLRAAGGRALETDATNVPAPQELTGGWTLSFPSHWGAPAEVKLDQLISWAAATNPGVRYFSGTAVYERDLEFSPAQLSAGREVWLDLGSVKNFAEVTLNDHSFDVLWKPPFRVNLTAAAKAGVNHLSVKITNLWPNRLIGDEQLPPDCEWDHGKLKVWPQWLLAGKPSPTGRLAFATWRHYSKDSPLLESGLLGPVVVRTAELIPAR